jgi:hypothetical protein
MVYALARRGTISLTLATRSHVFGACDIGLEVLGETAIAVEPSQGTLHHPAARQQDKALDGVGSLDDLEGPAFERCEGGPEFGLGIDAIGKSVVLTDWLSITPAEGLTWRPSAWRLRIRNR